MVHLAMAVISIPVQTPDVPVSFLAATIPATAPIMAETVVAPAALTAAGSGNSGSGRTFSGGGSNSSSSSSSATTRAAQVDEGINAEILTPPNRKS